MLFDVENSNFIVQQDQNLGRVMISRRNMNAGEILFYEKALVYSTDDDESVEPEYNQIVTAAFPKSIIKNLSNIFNELTNLNRIQSLDTAKNFILLLAILIIRKKDPSNQLFLEKCSKWDVNQHDLLQKINLLDHLTAHHLTECIQDAIQIQSLSPQLIPSKSLNITAEEVGKLIGILNTNQLEMDIGGSGLFVGTAIIQHDCYANCSFTTHENLLYLVTVRDILAGEALSIDYGNNFYHPTFDRIRELHETYGFICQCTMCTGYDKKRGFRCPHCQSGVVFPLGVADSPQTRYNLTCCHCHGITSIDYLNQCYERENFYLHLSSASSSAVAAAGVDKETESKSKRKSNAMNQVNDDILSLVQSERFLHETHYLLFWALDNHSLKMTEKAQEELFVGQPIKALEYYKIAQIALTEAIRLMEIQLPTIHHEKVIYYDRLAQIAIGVSDIPLAQSLFRKAYENSCMACGNTAPPTLAIRALVEHTPTSLTELANRYYS